MNIKSFIAGGLLLAILGCVLPVYAQTADTATVHQATWWMKADSLMALHQYNRALRLLWRCDTTDIDVLLRMGSCSVNQGAVSEAIRPYRAILAIDSGNVTALNQLGLLYTRRYDFKEAMACFFKLHQADARNSYYCKQIAALALRQEKPELAAYWYRKTISFNPSDIEACVALGKILIAQKNFGGVDSVAMQGLSVEPDFPPLQMLLAESAFMQGRYEAVTFLLNKMVTTDTTAAQARLLGLSYYHLNQYAENIQCMNFLIQHHQEHPWTFYYKGVSLKALDDYPASVEALQLAIDGSIPPSLGTYYFQLGDAQEKRGNYTDAINHYRTAYQYSADPIMLYHLARLYDLYYQDRTVAVRHYKLYLASNDSTFAARKYARSRLNEMGYF